MVVFESKRSKENAVGIRDERTVNDCFTRIAGGKKR